jgi:5-methylcytosine-specific restriction endonuclease McrA
MVDLYSEIAQEYALKIQNIVSELKRYRQDTEGSDPSVSWREGGRTVAENCQMLCRECNRRKGAK